MLLVCLVSCLLGQASQPASAEVLSLSVEMVGFHSDAGHALVLVYTSKDGWPRDPSKATRAAKAKIVKGKAVIDFTDLALGDYAVAVQHDENDDGKLGTNFIGIPNEGVGVSRNAKGFMGPPKFDACRFSRDAPGQRIEIKIVYL